MIDKKKFITIYYLLLIVILILFLFVFNLKNVLNNNENYTDTEYLYSVLHNFQKRVKRSEPSELEGVDCIYCIYLPDRKEYVENTLRKYGIKKYTMVEACTPKDLTYQHYNKLSTTFDLASALYSKTTKLAVHMSYLICMYNAMINKYDTILIFEDDIYFEKNLSEMTRYIQNFVNNNYGDVFFLGYCWLNCNTKVKLLDKDIGLLPKNTKILCKHGIVHRTRYFEDFFKEHKKLNITSDNYFSNYFIKKNLDICILRQPIVFQERETIKSQNGNFQKLHHCIF